MTAMAPSRIVDSVDEIREDYREMPDLHLTVNQARRLWHLDSVTCEAALETLLADGFLRRTRQGGYVRAAH